MKLYPSGDECSNQATTQPIGRFDSQFQNLLFYVRKHVVWAIRPGFGQRSIESLLETAILCFQISNQFSPVASIRRDRPEKGKNKCTVSLCGISTMSSSFSSSWVDLRVYRFCAPYKTRGSGCRRNAKPKAQMTVTPIRASGTGFDNRHR